MSLACLPPVAPFARSPPLAALTLRSAHQACGGRAPHRRRCGFAILGFMRCTTRKVFAPMALTSTCPHAPQKSRHAATLRQAQGRRMSCLLRRRRVPRRTRYARRSAATRLPWKYGGQSAYAGGLAGRTDSGGCFAAETEGVLCVRSPKTAHTRRPARRIKRPSVPPAARGSAPAAALKAAGRRKTWPLRVHARRSCFSSHPLRLSPLAGAGALVAPSRASLQAALLRRSEERRLSSRASGSRYSPESRLHNSPDLFAAACR